MSPYAPRVTVVRIPVDKIGAVIGPKGAMINSIQDETGAQITIEDDGTIYVGASDGLSAQAAVDQINAIANPQMPKVGERFLGTVVKTAAFGAFVSLLPGKDGLVHISKLGRGKRIGKVEDVVNVGDKIQVEIAEIDQRGKISLILVDDDAPAPAARRRGHPPRPDHPVTHELSALPGPISRGRADNLFADHELSALRGAITRGRADNSGRMPGSDGACSVGSEPGVPRPGVRCRGGPEWAVSGIPEQDRSGHVLRGNPGCTGPVVSCRNCPGKEVRVAPAARTPARGARPRRRRVHGRARASAWSRRPSRCSPGSSESARRPPAPSSVPSPSCGSRWRRSSAGW